MRWTLAALVLFAVFGSASACRCDRHATVTVPASGSTAARDASAADDAKANGGLACVPDPSFPSVFDVPEASAAAEVELRRGVRELLVLSDSENQGAAVAYALPDGPARSLRVPLDPRTSDDAEGMAWHDGHLYVLISNGFVERFTPDGTGGLTRDGDAYPLGAPPYSQRSIYLNGAPPDFEGLCLRAAPAPERCAGYAASRAYGWLVCLVFDGARLRVDAAHPRITLPVKKHSLSDCAFGAADGPARDTVLVTTNLYGGSTVYRFDEGTTALTPLDVETTPSNEAVAVDRDGRLYQMMDANSERSQAMRATCTGW